MTLVNKVVWSEGMFLRPQHFQQQDRYFENLIGKCASALRPHAWGVKELTIDQDLLETGKFALTRCSGVMPDGTHFDLPGEADAPMTRDLSEEVENAIVYLALPVRDAQGLDIALNGSGEGHRRYASTESEVNDSSGIADHPAQLQVGRLAFQLLLEGEEREGYHCLGLARVVQVGSDKKVLFDGDYIPSAIDCQAAPKLAGFLRELEGLLNQRAESLAGRMAEPGRGGTAETADFLLLQAVNRYHPLVTHLARQHDLHPESLFRTLLEMAGELSTFTAKEKRPPDFPEYRHEALKESFQPVFAVLRQALSMVLERNAVAIPLEERKFGVRVATIADKKMLGDAMFVLAVGAEVPDETLRRTFPAQIKIGPVEKIRDLVNKALPGIGLEALPVAPRQIPFHAGLTYFSMDTKSSFWKELEKSGGLALHVAGRFPGLELSLWAIRR